MNTLQQQAQEQSLKNLIEDRGAGSEVRSRRAELTMRMLEDKFKGITYEEAILLANEAAEQLALITAMDPAFEFLVNSRNNALKWAEALNDREFMGRTDHMLPVHGLVLVDNVAVEVDFWISRIYYYEHHRAKIILDTIKTKLTNSSDWCGSLRYPRNIEFVEL